MKNPRIKKMLQKQYLQQALLINGEHIASLLYVLHANYAMFTKKECQKFINDHADTVEMLDCNGDKLLREHKVNGLLEDCKGYVSVDIASEIIEAFITKTNDKQKLKYYKENKELYTDNILIMLLTLHYDFGFGTKRMNVIIRAWKNLTTPPAAIMEWFESYVDAHIADTDAELYKAVDDLKRQKKRAVPKVTVQEEFEARRKLEALRAYQERMMAHEKS